MAPLRGRFQTYFWVALLALALARPAVAQKYPRPSELVQGDGRPAALARDASSFVYNCRISLLPVGWKFVPTEPFGSQAFAVAVGPGSREVILCKFFNVGVTDQRLADTMFADLRALLASQNKTLSELRIRPAVIGGVSGLRVSARADEGKNTQRFVAFVGAAGGREYEIIYFSDRTPVDADRAADAVFATFSLIDPKAQFKREDLKPPVPFLSKTYKYEVHMPAGWSKPLPASQGRPDAEFSVEFADHTALIIVPNVVGDSVDPDEAARVALRTQGWTADQPKRDELPPTGFVTYSASRPGNFGGRATHERARVWVGHGTVLYAIAMTALEKPDAMLAEALGAIDVMGIRGAADPDVVALMKKPAALLAANRPLRATENLRGQLQNELGLEAFRRGEFAAAADLFELALQYQVDPTFVANWLSALSNFDSGNRGFQANDAALARFPKEPSIVCEAAMLCQRRGDAKGFLRLCKTFLIDTSLVHDDLFYEYAGALLNADRLDDVQAAITAYRDRCKGPQVAAVQSELLVDQDKRDEAVAILDQRIREHPADAAILRQSLMIALLHSPAVVERAGKVLGELEHDGALPKDVALLRGQLAIARGEYADAKVAFEKAKSLGTRADLADKWIQIASAAAGQGKNSTLRKEIPAVDVPAEMFTAAKAPLDQSLGAAYRRSTIAIRIRPGEPQRITNDDVIEIYDQAGVERFTTLKMSINPLDERIYFNCVEVHDADGRLISRGNPDDYYVLDADGDESVTLAQSINVPVAGLAPGCTLHVRATREYTEADPKIRFRETLASHSLPTAETILLIDGDPKSLAIAELNGAKRIERTGGVAWHFDAPPCVANEPGLPEFADFVPAVAISDAHGTWKEEGLKYLGEIADRLKQDDAVKREAAALKLDGKSPMEKLRGVVDYVQTHCAYKAIAFGPKAYIPSPPAQIIAQRYGDCKDQALLVHLLLKECGIESHLALVRMDGAVYCDLPASTQFDHMIVSVPDCGGKSWWIDTTGRSTDAVQPTPGPTLLGRHALVLDDANPQLVALPEWDPTTSGLKTQRTLTVGIDGEINVVDHTVARGMLAGYFRTMLRASDGARRSEYAARMLGIDVSSVRNWSAKILNLDDVASNLTVDVTYTPRTRLKKTGTRYVGELPAPAEHSFILGDAVEHRRLPFKVEGLNYEVELEMSWPAGWSTEDFDGEIPSLDTPYGKVRLSFAKAAATADGRGRLTGGLDLRAKPGVFSAAKYDEYCKSRQAILDAWAIPLVFRTTPAAPAH